MAKTPLESRHERLAAALRANLKRRKAGGRAREAGDGDKPQSPAAADDTSAAEHDVLPPSRVPR